MNYTFLTIRLLNVETKEIKEFRAKTLSEANRQANKLAKLANWSLEFATIEDSIIYIDCLTKEF